MRSFLARAWPLSVFIILALLFFKQFIFEGKLPIPADTIVGMYHPWRDFYAKDYPNGIPFKNFLITDPVRQQYQWRYLSIESMKKGQLPLWNPYNFAGTPLLANFQSASFYPLNILFFILPFNLAWGILILLGPLLAGVFLYFYLRNLSLNKLACFLGSLAFSFSGFFIAWLEWGTIIHVALWLPLVLLSTDKIFSYWSSPRSCNSQRRTNKLIFWSVIYVFSLVSSFFAGHLQIFFYLGIFLLSYTFVRWLRSNKSKKIIAIFLLCFLLFAALTSIQWLSTWRFIQLSDRSIDQVNWQKSGWFIPWQNLIQFLAPDFFGNPSTLNYWGEWNYGEFIGYIGILPLTLAFFALFWRRDKKTLFFGISMFVSLILALPTPLAKLPYQLQIPLISTSQPTRLLFLVDFNLAVLAVLGLDYFLSTFRSVDMSKLKLKVFIVLSLISVAYGLLWVFLITGFSLSGEWLNNLAVARRNLIFPTGIFTVSAILLIMTLQVKNRPVLVLSGFGMMVLLIFDLFRFGWKFTPFSKEEWLFPNTETVKFLTSQPKPFRFMVNDSRIFPPNFATYYQLEDVSGYDPLYLSRYGELIAAWNREDSDISPFPFNRILIPQKYSSRIPDLLNVKYVLSLKDEFSPKLKLVFQEGKTKVYENKDVYPRAFLVYEYKIADDRQEAINLLFDGKIDLRKTAILEDEPKNKLIGIDEQAYVELISHETQRVTLRTKSKKPAILILGDNFYSDWRAFIDKVENKAEIFRVDFSFRGIIVPKGEHRVEFFLSI